MTSLFTKSRTLQTVPAIMVGTACLLSQAFSAHAAAPDQFAAMQEQLMRASVQLQSMMPTGAVLGASTTRPTDGRTSSSTSPLRPTPRPTPKSYFEMRLVEIDRQIAELQLMRQKIVMQMQASSSLPVSGGKPLPASLQVTESADSPLSETIQVSNTAPTAAVTVAMFDVQEKSGTDAIIDNADFTVTTNNSVADESKVVRMASLWSGDKKLSAKPVTNGGVVIFDNLGLKVPAKGVVTLTVKLDLAQQNATTYPQGETVHVDFSGIMSSANARMVVTPFVKSTATHTLRSSGATLLSGTVNAALVVNNTDSTKTYGSYKVRFDAQAFGESVYVPLTVHRGAASTVGVAYRIENSSGVAVFTGVATGASLQHVSGGTVGSNAVQIGDGETATFELTVPYDPSISGSYRVQVLGLNYGLTPSAVTAHVAATPAADFETSNLYITN